MRAFFCAVAASATLIAQGIENLNAVAWMQTSAEYQAVARQAYRSAQASLDRALADSRWTAALEQADDLTGSYREKPPAVILDLDETVLDNSPMQARNVSRRRMFNDNDWRSWVAEEKAGLVPGAREFLSSAHGRGVLPFYITNRQCNPENADDPTVILVTALQLPFAPRRLLCRTDTGDKSPRRKAVALQNRVLLIIGDDLNDFVTLPLELELRASFVADHAQYWGERWFMLPNPSYGSWERTLGTEPERKLKALRQ